MRGSYDPFGSCAQIVDKLLGNAYGIVEFVAKNMDHVRKASFYMKNIYDASQRFTNVVEFLSPDTAGVGFTFSLPEVLVEDEAGVTSTRQLTSADIISWTTTMNLADGTNINGDEKLWTARIMDDANSVVVALPLDAEPEVLERPMKIMLHYTIPAA